MSMQKIVHHIEMCLASVMKQALLCLLDHLKNVVLRLRTRVCSRKKDFGYHMSPRVINFLLPKIIRGVNNYLVMAFLIVTHIRK